MRPAPASEERLGPLHSTPTLRPPGDGGVEGTLCGAAHGDVDRELLDSLRGFSTVQASLAYLPPTA